MINKIKTEIGLADSTLCVCIKETETLLVKLNGYNNTLNVERFKDKVKESEFVWVEEGEGHCWLYKEDLMTLIGTIGIDLRKNFITLAEWREKQINSILYG